MMMMMSIVDDDDGNVDAVVVMMDSRSHLTAGTSFSPLSPHYQLKKQQEKVGGEGKWLSVSGGEEK